MSNSVGNIFQQQVEGLDFSDDEEVKKKEAANKADENAKKIDSAIRRTEDGIKAPEKWRLGRFKSVILPDITFRGWIGDKKSDFDSCIAAIVRGSSAIIAGRTTRVGKSDLAGSIAREIAKRGKYCTRYKEFTLFRYFDTSRFRSDGGLAYAQDDSIDADMFWWDDAGKNPIYKTAIELTAYGNVIMEILDARAERGKHTIITTRAKDGDELKAVLGEDVISRVQMKEGKKNSSVSIFLS